ncbi:MAG: asparaginase [Chloroflexota bacterium]
MDPAKPRIAVIGTGGSISTPGRNSLDLFEYSDHGVTLEIDELLELIPEALQFADVQPVRFRTLLSPLIGPRDWLDLNRLVHELVERDPELQGIVVTHGTATLEETAYFLNLAVKVSVPVVIVGSQRPPNGLSSDAGVNMVNAIRVAASHEARGLGVVTLLNDEIQAAREVTKGSTHRLEAFRAPDLGLLGYADPDGRIAIYRSPTRRHAPDTEFSVRDLESLPRVDIAYSYAGADGAAIDAFVSAGARAIVSAGQAPGRVTADELRALLDARRQGIVVVQATRAGSGRVQKRAQYRNQEFVPADNLNPQKARILAMLALTVTNDLGEIERMFDEY